MAEIWDFIAEDSPAADQVIADIPDTIHTEEENERLIAELEQYDRRHDALTREERAYSELLTVMRGALHNKRPGEIQVQRQFDCSTN